MKNSDRFKKEFTRFGCAKLKTSDGDSDVDVVTKMI